MAWIEKRFHRSDHEVRVGDVHVAQRIALIANALEVGDEPRSGLELFARQRVQPCQHGERSQALRGRRELINIGAPILHRERLHPLRSVRRHVTRSHQAVAARDRRHNRGGDLSPIEAVDPAAADVAQHGSQVWVAKQHARLHRRIQLVRGTLLAQQLSARLEEIGQVWGYDVPVCGERCGGLQDSAQAKGPEALEEATPRLDGARHRGGEDASPGISSWPRDRTASMVASSPERPAPISPTGAIAPAGQTIAIRSPPIDVMCGYTTQRTAFAAMTASTALPPSRSTCAPASDAVLCGVAMTPLVTDGIIYGANSVDLAPNVPINRANSVDLAPDRRHLLPRQNSSWRNELDSTWLDFEESRQESHVLAVEVDAHLLR